MTEIKDGGPAFPQHLSFSPVHGCMIESSIPGMSLRDYFAATVLPVIYAKSGDSWDGIARDAYRMADAMLKAREGK